MSNKEMLDIFTPEMEQIGVKSRDEVHRDGDWHQTFHCWLLYKENNRDYILFQKRHPEKKDFPCLLDITAAGHLEAGEGPEDGVRELREELGIDLQISDLTSLGIIPNSIITDHFIDNEFSHVFAYQFNGQISDFILQDDEVESIIQIEANLFGSFIRDRLNQINGLEYVQDQSTRQIVLSKEDFVPHEQAYIKSIVDHIDQMILHNKLT